MNTIHVSASTPYDVCIGKGLLSTVGERISEVKAPCRVLLISDDRVFSLYGQTVHKSLADNGFTVTNAVFPHGERSKTLATFGDLLEKAASAHLTRTDLIVALGGGVVGDMAGFTAACYLRGIDYIGIPTTLLAAVDSSVGGKTAVDLTAGKNLAGAFHMPRLVVCDTDTFATLDERERACGMGEVIKYGLMSDKELFTLLEQSSPAPDTLVTRCVDIKRGVVERDERESGERKLLNLGHTLGHAIETHSDFALSHGAAVAVGMHLICKASEGLQLAEEPLLSRVDGVLGRYGLPFSYDITPEELFEKARGDKKTDGDSITLVLPVQIGKCVLRKIPLDEFKALCSSVLQ